jgi:cell division protein FtsX
MTAANMLNNNVQVPIWAIGAIMTILIALFSFTYSFSKEFSKVATQIELNTVDIRYLQQTKTDKETILTIVNTLERIETKLDNHIAQSGNRN